MIKNKKEANGCELPVDDFVKIADTFAYYLLPQNHESDFINEAEEKGYRYIPSKNVYCNGKQYFSPEMLPFIRQF